MPKRETFLLLHDMDEHDLSSIRSRVSHLRSFVDKSTPDGDTGKSNRWRTCGVFQEPDWCQMQLDFTSEGHRRITTTVGDEFESVEFQESWPIIDPDRPLVISPDGTKETLAAISAWRRALRYPTMRLHSRTTVLRQRLAPIAATIAALLENVQLAQINILLPSPISPGEIRTLEGRKIVDASTESELLQMLPECLILSYLRESYSPTINPTRYSLTPPKSPITIDLPTLGAIERLRLLSNLPQTAKAVIKKAT